MRRNSIFHPALFYAALVALILYAFTTLTFTRIFFIADAVFLANVVLLAVVHSLLDCR